MNNSNYTYNNEAIGLVAIYTILKEERKLNIAKLSLVLPILFHEKTLSFLCENETEYLTLEGFVNQSYLLENFNNRFLTFLPITANIVTILSSAKLVKIQNNLIQLIPENEIDIYNKELGKRTSLLILGAKKFAYLLKEDVVNLYSQLKVLI